ncbi:unnamed protein product, partial [Choristocarpus tenellus]
SPSRSPSPERWEKRMREAKRKHRPRLRDWEREGFGVEGSQAAAAFESLAGDDAWEKAEGVSRAKISRERREDLPPHEFWERYERREVPVVISGIPRHEGWKTDERWTWECLGKRTTLTSWIHRYSECKLKCGEDDDGYSVKVRLKHFLRYKERQRDDSPLYVFDSHFDVNHLSKSLLDDFRVPDYFPDDLFEVVGEKRRPPYR